MGNPVEVTAVAVAQGNTQVTQQPVLTLRATVVTQAVGVTLVTMPSVVTQQGAGTTGVGAAAAAAAVAVAV